MIIILVGNPNSGKTTFFNFMTKEKQKIGNWPGVTIDSKVGKIKFTNDTLIDLPGIYSLSSCSCDELVTTNYLFNNNYDLIINVVDINLLERSLFLSLELQDLNAKMILILTHTNHYNKRDIIMNIKILEDRLGIKVIDIEDIKKDRKILFMNIINYDNNICRHLLDINNNYQDSQLVAYSRYKYIEDIIKKIYIKKNNYMLDKLFLNRIIGIIIFIFIIFFIYFFSIAIVGNITNDFIFNIINVFSNKTTLLLNYVNVYDWLIDLMVNGIINGLGIIISFIPQLLFFFLLTEILNQSGYIVRITYLFDGLLNKIGLSGKSMISFMVGMSCSVPGIMQCRIIENKMERLKTIALIPFIPCSAKLPIIMMISSYLGCDYLIVIIYLLSICVIIISSWILNKIVVSNNDTYFMELPSYQIPKFKIILYEVIYKIKEFIRKTGSIIIISSVIIWIFFNININNKSLLYIMGRGLSFMFYPFLGGNNWIMSLSILQGLISREQVVFSLNYLINNNLNIFSKPIILSFLIFNMFSIPCINSIIAIKRELGSFKKFFLCLLFQFIVAFLLSVIVYRIGAIIW